LAVDAEKICQKVSVEISTSWKELAYTVAVEIVALCVHAPSVIDVSSGRKLVVEPHDEAVGSEDQRSVSDHESQYFHAMSSEYRLGTPWGMLIVVPGDTRRPKYGTL
jgi:hypothetical protein